MNREREQGIPWALLGAAANILNEVVIEDDEEEPLIQPEMVELLVMANDRGEKPPRIINYFEMTIPSFNDKTFQSHFRITRQAFQVLLNAIGPLLRAKATAHKPTINEEKQILMVLWLLATPDSYRSVGERFDTAKSTLWNCFIRVVNALNAVASRFIKWPTPDDRIAISHHFHRFGRLNSVVGAIDGTYVPISAPRQNPETYINRKCFHGMTLQAIGAPSLKFIDCFTGYPSSVSDIRIFRNSGIHGRILNHPERYFSQNEYIIGDKAYPTYAWCVPPYINRGNLTPNELWFNTMQAKTRQVIERIFALFFGRLRRMRHLELHRDDLYAVTIIAACVIHNVCLLNEDDEVNNYINEGMPVIREVMQEPHDNEVMQQHHIEFRALTEQGKIRRQQLTRQLQNER